MTRVIDSTYADPLEVIWVGVAALCGFRVVRRGDVYASFDGQGTIALAERIDLDPDDSVAQMVLHELCHALVQGPEQQGRVDWGLSVEGLDALEEHACHRLQAALADPHRLRAFLAVTTDWRPYWDALPADPLADDGDPAVALARPAWERATQGPWAAHLQAGLTATAAIAAILRPYAAADSLWQRT